MKQIFTFRRAVAALLATAVAGLAVAPVHAQTFGPGLGTALVNGSNSFVTNAEPGQTFSQRMRVSNGTTSRREVQLYAGAAWLENGTLVDDAAGGSNALTQWVSLENNRVSLAAGGSTELDFSITVPRSAPDSELHAVIWAETGSARSGVRVRLDVAGDNGPAPTFAVDGLRPSRLTNGDFTIGLVTRNTGPLSATMSGAIRLLDGPGSAWIPDSLVPPTVVEPRTTTTVSVPMGAGADLAAGPWSARGYVHNGYSRVRIDQPVSFPELLPPSPGGSATGSLGSLGSSG